MSKKPNFKNIAKKLSLKDKKEKAAFERRKKAFVEDYERICAKHGVQLDIKAMFVFQNYNPNPQVKDWDEAKKENEQVLKQAADDRKTMTEEEFKKKYPDLPYVLPKTPKS